MPDGYDYTQDKDFLAAPQARQHAYLMANDADYAKAPPERQQAYLGHIRGGDGASASPYTEKSMAAHPPVAPMPGIPKSPSEMMGEGQEMEAAGRADLANKYVEAGPMEVGRGLKEANTLDLSKAAGGLHRAITGAGVTALPAIASTLPIAAIEAPLATAGSLAAAAGLQKGAETIAPHLGATPTESALAGDVAGLTGLKVGSDLPGMIRSGISEAISPRIAPGLSEEATANLAKPLARRGVENVIRAAAPGTKEFQFRDAASIAAPDIAEIARNAPLTKKGGIINPDFRPREFVEKAEDHLDKIWNDERGPQVARHATEDFDLKGVKTAKARAMDALDREKQPAAVARVEEDIGRMPDKETLTQAMERLKTLNAERRTFRTKAAQEQGAQEATRPMVNAREAERTQLIADIDKFMADRGEAGTQGFDKRFAALSTVRDAIRDQVNPAESTRLIGQLAQILRFRGPERLATGDIVNATAGRKIAKGLRQLAKTDLQPNRPGTRPVEQRPIRGLLEQNATQTRPDIPLAKIPERETGPNAPPIDVEQSNRPTRFEPGLSRDRTSGRTIITPRQGIEVEPGPPQLKAGPNAPPVLNRAPEMKALPPARQIQVGPSSVKLEESKTPTTLTKPPKAKKPAKPFHWRESED